MRIGTRGVSRSRRVALGCVLLLAGSVPALAREPHALVALHAPSAASALGAPGVPGAPSVPGALGARGARGAALAGIPLRGGAPAGPRVVGPAPLAAALASELTALQPVAGDDGMRESVRVALSEASASKREAQKLSGEEREQAMLAVTARYAAIAEDVSYAAAGRAEASFRAGELLRGAKQFEEAAVMFARATELGSSAAGGEEFAARGLLESAHLKRRARDVAGALTLYGAVRERFPGEKRSAAHAVTWQGKLQLQSDQREQGMATLLGFRELFPEYPAEAVRNADLVALEQLEAGDDAGARQTVEQVQKAMEGIVAEGGKRAESVGKALAAMRVTEQLAGY